MKKKKCRIEGGIVIADPILLGGTSVSRSKTASLKEEMSQTSLRRAQKHLNSKAIQKLQLYSSHISIINTCIKNQLYSNQHLSAQKIIMLMSIV